MALKDDWTTEAMSTNVSVQMIGERYALVVIYYATSSEQWNDEVNWLLNTTSVCEWNSMKGTLEEVKGVSCNDDGLLVALDLADQGPFLTVSIPTEISFLSNLQRLSLSQNYISLSVIPEEILNLTSPTSLDLSVNNINGEIPTELFSMTSLSFLNLRDNSLGSLFHTEFGLLTSLVYLDLRNNTLTGEFPTDLSRLTRLKHLGLSGNSHLGLEGPRLSGTLPSEMGLLTRLTFLDLRGAELSGSLPSELGLLTSLNNLDLSLNGWDGTLPSEIGLLSSLTRLDLTGTDLTGSIPLELSALTSIVEFNMFCTDLKGTLDDIFCSQIEILSDGIELGAECFGNPPLVECSCCSTCRDAAADDELYGPYG